jgi:hypothetical protein
VLKYNSTLVLIYNSFNDPLFQNLVFKYLKTLGKTNKYIFYLVTFEQEYFSISENEKRKLRKNLIKVGIYWYPLNYHTGNFLLFKKLYDFLNVLFLIGKIRLSKNTKVIFAFTNIAASFGIIFSKIFSMKMIVYSYEPHSSFLAELNIWSKKSLKYKLLNSIEKFSGIHGDYILTGTKHMVRQLKNWGAKGKVIRAPTSVDEFEYYFREEGRKKIRERLQLFNKDVLIYIGKLGDLYYKDEVADLCKSLLDLRHKFFFIIVTSNNYDEIKEIFKNSGLDSKDFYITGNLTYDEVKDYLSAADIGLSAVPPTPSQRFRSPTKVGEYLLCGLPYITCRGISEDDSYAEKYNVGVALDNFNDENIQASINKINFLLDEDKTIIRKRCREVGLAYRAKSNVDKILSKIYSEIF